MSQTLPLFDSEDTGPETTRVRAGANGAGPAASASERHLRAARRLSRAMGRFPEGSVEQTRAGLAICRHLQALLAEAQR